MVNRHAMNIDVREYLRTNPISVHELTMSNRGNDCFLVFDQVDGQGRSNYSAWT